MRQFAIILIFFSNYSFVLFAQSNEKPNQKLFSLLSSDHTGIKFNNLIKDTKKANITLYSNFYGGAGVGVGDLNNDGLQDIYFAGNLVGDKLYLNKGGLKFEDITVKAGINWDGGWSSGVLMGDVNKDGHTDIYVTRELYDDNPLLRANKLYINKGNLKFVDEASAYGVADTARTRHASFIDYDKDGDLDLLLLNQPPNPGDYSPYYGTELIQPKYGIKLMQNIGSTFIDITEKAGLKRTGFPNSVTASDLNGDGWTDLFISNDFWIEDWMFLNNGDGTFTEKIHQNVNHISFSSMGVDAGDINNDGMLDLIVVDMVAEDNYRIKANMSGMNPDAFWKVVNDGGHHQYMFNMLHYNTGNAQFSDIAQLAGVASTDWSWSSLFADFDNDGWKDLFITNGLMRDIRNKDAHKTFAHTVESSLAEYLKTHPNPPADLSIWDIIDLEKTLSVTPSVKLKNYIFKNNGDLTFTKKMDDWGMTEKSFSNGASYADLDNDGDLDLIVSNINDIASIYQNNSNRHNHYLRIEAINDDKRTTVMGTKIWLETNAGNQFFEITGVRGMYSTSENLAHFGTGSETLIKKLRIHWPDGYEQILENINADQVLKLKHSEASLITFTPEISAPVFVEMPSACGIDFTHKENVFDDYKIQVLLPHKMSNMGPFSAVGDVNGDKLDDVFIGGAAAQPGALYVQNPGGEFELKANDAFTKDKVHEDMGSAFFDADGDGDQDLYVVSGGNEFMAGSKSYQDRLYLNDGTGVFDKAVDALPTLNFSGSKVRPYDYDQDGDMDLLVTGRHMVWSYPLPASSVLLKNDKGKFMDITSVIAKDLKDIGMVNDAVWTDIDNDGKHDILLSGEWMPIVALINKGDHFERKNDIKAFNENVGWWFSIKSADMDGDGDQDIIAGNLGKNYKYKATAKEPFEVYYYDFDDNGYKDVVLTYYNFGEKYPLRGRQCSSQQIPMLAEKFPTYNKFASSNVDQIFGESKLKNALHYAATNFASTYFENKGNGQFEAYSLPVEAQFSAINDIIIRDIDHDGDQDLITAGNLFSSEVETARNDAGYGLCLLNHGKGHFTPIPKSKSGLYLPYDVKSLSVLKAGEKELMVVGCNNSGVKVVEMR